MQVLPGRDRPAPPAQARQHRAARRRPRGASGSRPAADGGRPDPPPPQGPRPGAGRRPDRRPYRCAWPCRRSLRRILCDADRRGSRVAVLIALGGAGVVAAMNHVPATAAPAELTWAADAGRDRAARRGDRAARDAGRRRSRSLGSYARQALAAVVRGRRGPRSTSDVAAGTLQLGAIEHGEHAPRGVARRDPGRRRRQRRSGSRPRSRTATTASAGRPASATGLDDDWAAVHRPGARRRQPQRAARPARPGDRGRGAAGRSRRRYPQALAAARRVGRDDRPGARPSATASRPTTDVATLTALDRPQRRAYDAALRHLYEVLVDADGEVTGEVRAAFDGEQQAARAAARSTPGRSS